MPEPAGAAIEIPAAIPADAEQRLAEADVTVVGRMPNASNATFLVRLDEPPGLAIYKPGRGERPLWDFPRGLFRRETAAYQLSAAAGFDVIPPTVIRDDAPLGPGSLQWFVNADFSEHYFSLAEQRPQLHDQLRAIAAFDVIANNTDRKSGHCLFEPAAGHVWGIDNGLCFSVEARLRTVIWEFAGEDLPDRLRESAAAVAGGIAGELSGLLDRDEVEAMVDRAARLADAGVFPHDRSGHGYPWPLI